MAKIEEKNAAENTEKNEVSAEKTEKSSRAGSPVPTGRQANTPTTKEKNLSANILSFLKEFLVLVITAFVLALVFKTFIFQPFKVEMSSMVPTVMPSDRVLVNKFIYRFGQPKRGDIVTVYSPEEVAKPGFSIMDLFSSSRKILIKRIIATEGQTIVVRSGKVFINDKPIGTEKYVKFKDFSGFGPVKVPKDNVFVMGDNRPNSKDSRAFGSVKESEILGKAFFIYWPFSAIKGL